LEDTHKYLYLGLIYVESVPEVVIDPTQGVTVVCRGLSKQSFLYLIHWFLAPNQYENTRQTVCVIVMS